MKKISLVISSYDDLKNPYFAGGGARSIHEVAKRLATKGYTITVLTGKYPQSKNENIDGVAYQRIGTSFLGAQLDQITFQLCLPFHIVTKKFAIWLESFTPPFSTTALQFFTKKPIIGIAHMLSGEDMKRKYKLPFDLIEKIGLKTYRYLIAPSQAIASKMYQANTKAQITIIPNGIEKIPPPSQAKPNHILFLGRIEIDQKGLDLLLQAYAQIATKIPYPLYIAGSGDEKEEAKLHRLLTSLGLAKQVKILGKVTGKEKEKLYQEAVFVVIPSRFDTFSMVALEAMSYAKAVVSFAIDGLQWIPKEAGIKIKPYDKVALAEAMLSLASNTTIHKEMGMYGQNYAKKFTWEDIAKQYEACIQMVLKK